MDAVRLSLPPVPVRTVSASASTSYSVPINSWSITARQKLWSCRTRPRFRNHSSAVPQLTVTCAAGVAEINESQFEETVLQANRPVLVEFVATWCGPCRLISPAMESLAKVSFFSLFRIPIFFCFQCRNATIVLLVTHLCAFFGGFLDCTCFSCCWNA